MSTKILLTENNTPWGIRYRIVGDNTYDHVINFPDPELKNEFINNELFNGKDHEKLLENAAETGYMQIDDLNAMLRIDVSDYPNETINSLLNKDYAIVLDNDVKLFYALTTPTMNSTQGVITYTAELDIFFTYLTELNIQNQNIIYRGHADRYYKSIITNKVKWNKDDIIFLNEEEYYKDWKKYPTGLEEVIYEHTFIEENGSTFTNSEKEDINQTNWVTFYLKTGTDDSEGTGELDNKFLRTSIYFTTDTTTDTTPEQPFHVITLPTTSRIKYIKYASGLLSEEMKSAYSFNEWLIENNYTDWVLGITISKIPPAKLTVHKGNIKYGETDVEDVIYLGAVPGSGLVGERVYSPGDGVGVIRLDTIGYTKWNKEIEILPEPTIKFEPGQPRNIEFEIKNYLDNETYSLINKEDKYTIDNKLTDGIIDLELKKVYAPDEETIIIENKNGFYDYTKYSGNKFISTRDNELFYSVGALDSYITNNRYSRKTSLFTSGAGTAGSVAMAAGQGFTNPLADISALASTSKLINTLAQRKDLSARPTDIKGGSGGILDTVNGILDFVILKEKFLPMEEQTFMDYLDKYGYAINKIDDVNKYLQNRYYHNFIQASDIFNNITNTLSSRIKQLISNTFENGFTLWHYRNKETWKGINNFEFENFEVSMMERENK